MATKRSNQLYIANLSDIHFGHDEVSGAEIARDVKDAIPDNGETAKLDMILITGDVFDRLIHLSYEYNLEIKGAIWHLLTVAKKYDIVIRVLEGTSLHDRRQSVLFEIINSLADIGADLKYVKDLSIEYIERYGITVLYVPDEWEGGDTDKTLHQVKQLLRAKGLTHVDYAAMHGMFDFQLPHVAKAPKHNTEEYLKIVKKVIMIGHDHTPKRFERIYVPGSITRLTHGQEEPKGHMRFIVHDNGEIDAQFFENKNAKMFVTIDCRNLTVEETLEKIKHRVLTLPDGSHARVVAEVGHPIFSTMETLVRKYPLINWKKEPKGDKVKDDEWDDQPDVIETPSLTKDNLADQLMTRITEKTSDAAVLMEARNILAEVMNG